jgi:hypothetical protein
MDSRAVLGELAFRAKLLAGLGLFGGICGGIAWLWWALGEQQYTLLQYLHVLYALLFDPHFENLRFDFLISVAAGSVFLMLPPLVFYARSHFAPPEK